MRIQIYIYKRHDMDLLALADAGYPVTAMMKNAILAYAKSVPLFYCIDEYIPINVSEIKVMKVTFRIGQKETDAIKMLNSVVASKRSLFCKMLLRNAFIGQNINCFFIKGKCTELYTQYMNNFPDDLKNVIKLSTIRNTRTFNFLNKTFEKNSSTQETIMPVRTTKKPESEQLDKKVQANEEQALKRRVKDDYNKEKTHTENKVEETDKSSSLVSSEPPVMAFDNKLFSIFDRI